MALPSVYSLSTGRSSLTAFGGLNESYACAEAEFTRMQNFSSRGYPALQTRTPRRKMEAVEHCNGMYHLNGMLLCEGTTLRYKADHEETLATTAAEEEIVLKNAVSDSEKIMVGMGTKIILFPDKAAFDTKTGSLTPLGAGWESTGTVTLTPCDAAGRTYTATGHAAKEPDNPTDGQVFLKVINSLVPYSSESVLEVYNETLGSWSAVELNYCKIEATGIGKDFAVWDTVTISGIGANEDGYWKELTGDRVVYAQGDDFVQVKAEPGGDYFYGTLTKEGDRLSWRSIDGKGSGLEGSLELFRVERRVPDLDFLTECDNRVWGCSSRENVIYGCKLGDPTNWFSYRGTAADSYAVTVGSDGEFTGAATCMGYALFFKENTLHKLYGSRPADFRLVSVQCRGVAKHASRSLCVIAEVLYYLSNDGVMAWDGSLPVKISGVLDSTWLMNVRGAVGGVLDTRYYLHMRQPSTGETRLLVYDTERQLWHEEDVAGDSEAEGWAILTLNPGVAIAQAASLPTAGAVLGSDTMAAVLPFVKNLSGKQRRALEAEISAHGDALLQYRLRGSQRGELASIGVSGSFAEKAMDKLPKSVTGWINSMDEITVAALWEASKHYVEHHVAEFADGAATKGSDAYWKAVNQVYQRVIEETQPNYTVMQRAGIQRSDNEITKTLTMFTTQRFQNYGILADAVMDYKAQRARYNAEKSAENKAEVQRAGQSLRRAAASQVIQTAVFALMKIGADFLLHRWDREQDENGDVTAESLWNRFAGLFTESAAGNFLFGSEIYSMVGNAVNGTDYDVVSATNISAVNDLFAAATKLYTLIRKDTTGMDEEELEAYHRKLRKAGVDVMEYGLDIAGIPAANGRKMVEAFAAYADDVQGLANGEGFSLNGTPASATGQYDRLFNAIERGDAEEAAAALGKLDQMGKSDKVKAELKKRLKNYDPDIETAAKARNAGNDRTRQKATEDCIRALYKGLGIREGVKEDAAKREAIIDLVTGAVNQKADELLAGDKDRNVYDDLTDALEVGRAKDVQTEVNRLLTAGKDKDAIKSKITGVVKSEYLAGNDHDREKLAEMLLRLEAGGEPLYEEKNFESWIKQDEKKQEAAAGAVDEWAEVR